MFSLVILTLAAGFVALFSSPWRRTGLIIFIAGVANLALTPVFNSLNDILPMIYVMTNFFVALALVLWGGKGYQRQFYIIVGHIAVNYLLVFDVFYDTNFVYDYYTLTIIGLNLLQVIQMREGVYDNMATFMDHCRHLYAGRVGSRGNLHLVRRAKRTEET